MRLAERFHFCNSEIYYNVSLDWKYSYETNIDGQPVHMEIIDSLTMVSSYAGMRNIVYLFFATFVTLLDFLQ